MPEGEPIDRGIPGFVAVAGGRFDDWSTRVEDGAAVVGPAVEWVFPAVEWVFPAAARRVSVADREPETDSDTEPETDLEPGPDVVDGAARAEVTPTSA